MRQHSWSVALSPTKECDSSFRAKSYPAPSTSEHSELTLLLIDLLSFEVHSVRLLLYGFVRDLLQRAACGRKHGASDGFVLLSCAMSPACAWSAFSHFGVFFGLHTR